jgi:hypothetical protein
MAGRLSQRSETGAQIENAPPRDDVADLQRFEFASGAQDQSATNDTVATAARQTAFRLRPPPRWSSILAGGGHEVSLLCQQIV